MPKKRRRSGNSISLSSFSASSPVTRSRAAELTADELCNGIIECLENTEVPLESPTIARSFGEGSNIWAVRKGLQCLKEWEVVRKKDKDGWILSEKDGDMECFVKDNMDHLKFDEHMTPTETTVDC